MKDEEFISEWNQFRTDGFLLHELPGKKLISILEFLSMRYFSGMEANKDRYELFLAEYNARSSNRLAKSAVMLAFIASIIGVTQIVFMIIQLKRC